MPALLMETMALYWLTAQPWPCGLKETALKVSFTPVTPGTSIEVQVAPLSTEWSMVPLLPTAQTSAVPVTAQS